MSRLLETASRTDEITRAIEWLIAQGGLSKITTRAIAEKVGISVGTLSNHLTNRERILRVCGHNFGRTRLDGLGYRVRGGGAEALLPATPEELMRERVWLGWRELARDDANLARTVKEFDDAERSLLRRECAPAGTALDAAMVDALMATLVGLRDAMCAHGTEAMPAERAQQAWAVAVSAAGLGVPA